MHNNDILRRIRYIFDFGDDKMIALFASGEKNVNRAEISDWLKSDDHPEFVEITTEELACFLNGLINIKRGKREGVQPEPEIRMSNNVIFRKLKIALNLKAEDILEVFALADFDVGKSEISAIFRKPEHRHYRQCKDQFLRNFLYGLQLKHRPNDEA